MKTIVGTIATLVIGGLVTAGIILFVGLDWGAEKAHKESQAAAAAAIQAMSYSQEMHERLGTPFSQGEVTIQSADLKTVGTSTMQLSVMIKGPKGSGKASCTLSKSGGAKSWQLTNGMFFPTEGPPISIRPRPAPGAKEGVKGGPLPGYSH